MTLKRFLLNLDKDMDMQVELAHQHHQQHQQQQRSYMNLSIPYPVPQSTSNYHLISDPNAANNNMVRDFGDMIDFPGSDSASHSSCSVASSAASSSVHLPLGRQWDCG